MTPPATGSDSHPAHEGDWICANCGTVHNSNSQPCRECAGERFARLEAESTPDIDTSVSITYRCKECGQTQPRNSTPCNNCGNLTFDAVNTSTSVSGAASDVDSGESTIRKITVGTIAKVSGTVLAYVYGAGGLIYTLGFFAMGLVVPSLLMLTGTIIALPLARRQVENLLSIDLSRGVIVVLVILFHAPGLLLATATLAS